MWLLRKELLPIRSAFNSRNKIKTYTMCKIFPITLFTPCSHLVHPLTCFVKATQFLGFTDRSKVWVWVCFSLFCFLSCRLAAHWGGFTRYRSFVTRLPGAGIYHIIHQYPVQAVSLYHCIFVSVGDIYFSVLKSI